jgi:hypothetical protein
VKHILRQCTPPLLWKLASSVRRGAPADSPPRVRPERYVEVSDVDPMLLQYLSGQALLPIATAKLRYSGGLAYTYEQHHFMQYYLEGPKALTRFYQRHQPVDLLERHFLQASQSAGLPRDGYPWIWPGGPRRNVARGEEGLGLEHGRQQYGPATPEKIALEARRLDQIHRSIRDNGYLSRLSGYPRGYFLVDGLGDWVFHVKGGQHRVAAMAHLAYPHIPASFHPDHPRVVCAADVDRWPMVRSGQVTRDEALLIFKAYFRPVHSRIWS